MRINDQPYCVFTHASEQTEARKDHEGSAPVIVPDEDLITRVVTKMSLKLRWEHMTDRKWAAWYEGGIELMQEIAK